MDCVTDLDHDAGWVSVKLEMAHVPPAMNETESKLMSAPDVPHEPWKTVTPLESLARKWPAVPVAAMFVSLVIALAVAVPPEAEPNAGSLIGSVARSVPESGSVVLVGAAPVRMVMLALDEPPSRRPATALTAALRAESEIFMEFPFHCLGFGPA